MPQAPGLLLQHKAQGFPGHQLRVALMGLVGEVRTCRLDSQPASVAGDHGSRWDMITEWQRVWGDGGPG